MKSITKVLRKSPSDTQMWLGAYVNWEINEQPAICSSFVQKILGKTPNRIRVTVATDKIKGGFILCRAGIHLWRQQNATECDCMFDLAANALDTLNVQVGESFYLKIEKTH